MKIFIPIVALLASCAWSLPKALGQPAAAATAPAAGVAFTGPGARVVATVGSTRNGMTVYWDFDKALESSIDGFILERQDSTGASKPVGARLDPKLRKTHDAGVTGKTGSYVYVIVTLPKGGTPQRSNPFTTSVSDIPLPPVPTGLTARLVQVEGKELIELHWNSKAAGDKLTVGYQIQTDSSKAGELMPHDGGIPIKGNTYRFDPFTIYDQVLRIGVAGVSDAGHVGEPAETALALPGREMRTPALSAAVDKDGKVTLSWKYQDTPSLAGFRIERHLAQVVDEKTLGGIVRQWVDPEPVKELEATDYTIAAVSKTGVVSFKCPQVWVKKPSVERAVVPGSPESFRVLLDSNWTKRDGRDGILLTWTAPTSEALIAKYQLSVDATMLGTQDPSFEINPGTSHQYFYAAQGPPRSYWFYLDGVDASGKHQHLGMVMRRPPGQDMEPVFLRQNPKMTAKDGKTVVVLEWAYNPDQCRSYRVYQNGAQVATIADSWTRTWTTATLELGEYIFEVEAVNATGKVSERGPRKVTIPAPTAPGARNRGRRNPNDSVSPS